MSIKRNTLIISLIAIFCLLFLKGVPTAKALTIDELNTRAGQLQTQLNQLSSQISSLQTQINQLKADIAKLKTEKPITPVVPETQYACPDIDRSGKLDVKDFYVISRAMNTCKGNSSYNSRADFDGDGCITDTDYNFFTKYYGKNDSEIPQCKGVTTSTLEDMEKMMASIAETISQITAGVQELLRR